jgi:hypothetical protein
MKEKRKIAVYFIVLGIAIGFCIGSIFAGCMFAWGIW